jgi:hypothetical protein
VPEAGAGDIGDRPGRAGRQQADPEAKVSCSGHPAMMSRTTPPGGRFADAAADFRPGGRAPAAAGVRAGARVMAGARVAGAKVAGAAP